MLAKSACAPAAQTQQSLEGEERAQPADLLGVAAVPDTPSFEPQSALEKTDRAPAAAPPPLSSRARKQNIRVRTYCARLRGPLPARGRVQMAGGVMEKETALLDPAPRGPGVDTFIEAIASGSNGRALRWHNSGEHPLTLAWHMGKITDAHFAAGEMLRALVETLERGGKDSTDNDGSHGSGGHRTPWSENQVHAIRELEKIQRRMRKADFTICRKFCGERYSMVDALRSANISFDKNRVVARVCIALDYLSGNRKKFAHKRSSRKKVAGKPLTAPQNAHTT
jgi:hypothetical protein